jgi:hypothetical protein
MSLNEFVSLSEKKWMNIGCENLHVYGSSTINNASFANGTAAAPSISFTSEPSTGIYKAGAGDVGISILGTEVVDIKTGCVDINSTAYTGFPLSATLTGNGSQPNDVGKTMASFNGGGQRISLIDQDLSNPNRPPAVHFTTGAGGDIKLNGKKGVQLFDNGSGPLTSVIVGTQTVVPNAATDGFLYIPTMVGSPIGVPSLFAASSALCVDGPGQKLWVYSNGNWHGVALA